MKQAETERLGRQAAEATQAGLNLLSPIESYGQQENTYSDDRFPTRLGVEQMTLVLAYRDGDRGLKPWSDDPHPVRALALSEVQMALQKYKQLPLGDQQRHREIAAFTANWKDWELKAKAVAVVEEDGSICEGLRYCRDLGLVIRL